MSEIRVIGAGFGRTGTLTLKTALQILGFDPCYHMKEVMFKAKHEDWIVIEEGDKSDAEKEKLVKKALEGYQASVDFPSSMYYMEQMKLYPNAKVLLSVRDNPESWVKSVKATIFGEKMGNQNHLVQKPWFISLVLTVPFIGRVLPFSKKEAMLKGMSRMFLDKEHKWDDASMAKVYTDWIEHVKQTVPKEKLLIFNVKEGWKPLCEFLDVPIPDTPMPRVNDTAEFHARFRMIGLGLSAIVGLWYSLVGFGTYKVYQYFQ